LGVFHWEAEKNLSAPLILNPELLKIMNAVFSLVFTLLPERESYENLYNETLNLLKDLPNAQNPRDRYLQWEIVLLRELGYALDLSKCSGCGRTDNLRYLSPRTGRAVCVECGEPYRGRLYDLPLNLDTTLRFISGICDVQGTDIPPARKIL
jgi:DNA repair protein RecO (recombination protein O)